ncbi:MAG: hypothetical protein N2484_17075 [Clostridia bacterium]|nr:hypothetical protein [Clostridia bacterium]
MLVIGTFEHSIELEQALAVLEHGSISRSHIMVVPMDTSSKIPYQVLGKAHDLRDKGMEVGIACATACSVIGTSVGFVLPLGPVFWGLAAAVSGFSIGFGTYIFYNKNFHRHLPNKLPEVTVIIQCPECQSIQESEIMWKYGALTVGHTPEPA